jgi:integrase
MYVAMTSQSPEDQTARLRARGEVGVSDIRTSFEGMRLPYIAVKQRTLAIKTIRNHIVTMHSVFEAGLRKGWCQTNPVKLADRPVIRTTETRNKYLDQDELEKLLAASYPEDAFGRIEPTLYLTAAMTGLRQGELLGRRWRDIDFDARRVRVVSPFVRGEFGDPKPEGLGPLRPARRARRGRASRTPRPVDVSTGPGSRVLPPGHG